MGRSGHNCFRRSGKQWEAVLTEAQQLITDIKSISAQIDRRLDNKPGTAERGLYHWHWPPTPTTSIEVLTNLHADSVAFLHTITTKPTTLNPSACTSC